MSSLRTSVSGSLVLALVLACGGGSSVPDVPPLPADLAQLTADVAEAVRRAHEDVVRQPGDAATWSRLGMVYHANRLLPAADEAYGVAVELEPESARHRYRRALCRWELGRTEEAVAELREALRLAPSRLSPNWRLGTWLLELGDLDAAAERMDRAAEIQPGFPPAWIGLARIHLLRDETDEALEILDRLAAVLPNDRYVGDLRDMARRQAGLEPLGTTRRSRSFEPSWTDPWEDEILKNRAEAPLTRAIRALEEGRPNRAVPLLETERERRPDDTTVLRNLAAAYTGAGRPADAQAALMRCVELQPENTTFLLEAAESFEASGDLERALELIDRAAASEGGAADRRWLHQRRGRLLHALGRHLEAVPDLREVLARQPDDTKYSVWLGRSLLALDDVAGAAAVFEAGLEYRPKNAELAVGLAEARLRTGDLDGAERALARIDAPGDQAEPVRRLRARIERRRARASEGDTE